MTNLTKEDVLKIARASFVTDIKKTDKIDPEVVAELLELYRLFVEYCTKKDITDNITFNNLLGELITLIKKDSELIEKDIISYGTRIFSTGTTNSIEMLKQHQKLFRVYIEILDLGLKNYFKAIEHGNKLNEEIIVKLTTKMLKMNKRTSFWDKLWGKKK